MPLIYSASRLRREVGTPPRRSSENTQEAPVPFDRNRYVQAGGKTDTPAVMTGRSRRGSTLVPESIALPPSSSATGPSSTSSSPLAHQSSLPLAHMLTTTSSSTMIHAQQQQQQQEQQNEEKDKKHDRRKSRSRDTFEEGVLKEMRERLAAAGLGDVVKSKN